tara:strand:+ start:4132 stop:4347 length:216 start_codon:yes stop_codon:yes gene_type:complete
MTLDELKLNYRRTFTSDDGAVVLEDLKKRFSFNQTTHQPGDPHESAFLEGQRYAILTIINLMTEQNKGENV